MRQVHVGTLANQILDVLLLTSCAAAVSDADRTQQSFGERVGTLHVLHEIPHHRPGTLGRCVMSVAPETLPCSRSALNSRESEPECRFSLGGMVTVKKALMRSGGEAPLAVHIFGTLRSLQVRGGVLTAASC